MSAHLEVKQRNAISWLLKQGYRPVLGGLRDLHNFELENQGTGEVEYFNIDDVIAEYDQDRKDEARARAAERRQQAELTPIAEILPSNNETKPMEQASLL